MPPPNAAVPPMKVHNPLELWNKQQEENGTVTRAEFDKRMKAPQRIDHLETQMSAMKGEIDTLRSMLRELLSRFDEAAKAKKSA